MTAPRPLAFLSPLLFLATGCAPPVDAPEELDEVAAWLFARFEDPGYGELEAGSRNLAVVFDDADFHQDAQERGIDLDPLSEVHAIGLEHPGRDFDDLVSVGLPFASAWAVEDHASLLLLEDQTPVEPDSPEHYRRRILEPADPTCFPDRTCSTLRSWNDVIKQSAVMTIPYEMGRDFRWVELDEPGSARWALLSRAWIEEEAWDAEGNAGLLAMFSLELTWPTDGGSARFVALWTESHVFGVGPEIIAPAMVGALQNTYEAVEDYLAER